MTLAERIRTAMKYAKLNQNEIAEAVRLLPGGEKFSQQSIQQLLSGRSKSSIYLVHVAMACGVDPRWLATGIGVMTKTGEVPPPAYAVTDKIRHLDAESRHLVESMVDRLMKKE